MRWSSRFDLCDPADIRRRDALDSELVLAFE